MSHVLVTITGDGDAEWTCRECDATGDGAVETCPNCGCDVVKTIDERCNQEPFDVDDLDYLDELPTPYEDRGAYFWPGD